VPLLLGCGVTSSTTAMLVTYPLNLLRTRLQVAGLQRAAAGGGAASGGGGGGALSTARSILAADGARGFYRGLLPNAAKVLPATGISYTVFNLMQQRLAPAQ
jgi:solute carrier family 25 phosphate transporter 23/24/25/41